MNTNFARTALAASVLPLLAACGGGGGPGDHGAGQRPTAADRLDGERSSVRNGAVLRSGTLRDPNARDGGRDPDRPGCRRRAERGAAPQPPDLLRDRQQSRLSVRPRPSRRRDHAARHVRKGRLASGLGGREPARLRRGGSVREPEHQRRALLVEGRRGHRRPERRREPEADRHPRDHACLRDRGTRRSEAVSVQLHGIPCIEVDRGLPPGVGRRRGAAGARANDAHASAPGRRTPVRGYHGRRLRPLVRHRLPRRRRRRRSGVRRLAPERARQDVDKRRPSGRPCLRLRLPDRDLGGRAGRLHEHGGDGDLRYTLRVSSDGFGFASTEGDAGTVTGVFLGALHESVGGALERSDLRAAFGASRWPRP